MQKTNKPNIQAIGEFLKDLKSISRVDLLPFHKLGVTKYEKLDLEYACKDFEAPSEDEMKAYKEIMDIYHSNVKAGD